jgi:PAS domain S-box-containing protein
MKVWRKLTEPHPRIKPAADRRQMRIFMSLSILILPTVIVAFLIRWNMGDPRWNLALSFVGLCGCYALTRTRWWKFAAPAAVILLWLTPLGGIFERHPDPELMGLLLLLWYINTVVVIFILYSLRTAVIAAFLSYGVALALNSWFAPLENTYLLFASLIFLSLIMLMAIIALILYGNETERRMIEAAEYDARRLAEALSETALTLSSTLDLEEVLDRILARLAEIVPSSGSDIMLIEDGAARVVRSRGYAERGIEQAIMSVRLSVREVPNLRQMFDTGKPLLIADTRSYPDWVDLPIVEWIRSEMGAPIRLEGETIGFLNVNHERPNMFTIEHANYLAAFAVHAALALRNARLYDEARRYATDLEKEVSERTAQLHLTHGRLRAILDATGEGIFYTEGAYIQYANAALAQLTGYTQQELIGKTLENLRDPQLSMDELQQLRAVPVMVWKHGIWRGEARMRRKDGTTFYAGLTVSPVGSRNQTALRSVTLLRDISREKELALQKSTFVAHASHELRTPITNLKTRLYLLRKRPEYLNDHLTVLEEVAERMKRLVEDLLDRNRLERGQINVRREPVLLQDLLRRVEAMQRPEAERKPLALIAELTEAPLPVHVDPERIIQVFTNLVTNAINYTAPGGAITIRARAEAEHAVVEVEDTGVGIAPEHLPHIFEPFYRVVSQVEGTGLGLSIARQIVTLHGGEITVKSETGVGSCFTVSLQLATEPIIT